MSDISAFDIYDYLPERIKELLFSEFMNNLMLSVFSIANIPENQQTSLHRDTVSVLIGKYDLKQYETMLKSNYNLSDNAVTITMTLLNEKLFGQMVNILEKSRKIYKQFSEGNIENISQPKIPSLNNENKNPEQLMTYIQELAISMKNVETPQENIKKEVSKITSEKVSAEEKKIIINETRPEEVKTEPIIVESKPLIEEPVKTVALETKPVEEIPAFTPKETMVFKMMKQKEEQSNGKLNEYFKALKDNLNFESSHESENVFQPPFKATKGRSMMVESSITDDISRNDNTINEKMESKKEPIKYNSFEYMKKPNAANESKPADDKFIDLGDF